MCYIYTTCTHTHTHTYLYSPLPDFGKMAGITLWSVSQLFKMKHHTQFFGSRPKLVNSGRTIRGPAKSWPAPGFIVNSPLQCSHDPASLCHLVDITGIKFCQQRHCLPAQCYSTNPYTQTHMHTHSGLFIHSGLVMPIFRLESQANQLVTAVKCLNVKQTAS